MVIATDRRTDVAVACRALAAMGLGAGIGGHVSVRDEAGRGYWVNRVDRQFSEVRLGDVVLVDIETGAVVEGDSIPSPGVSFHNAIYQSRPDVNAIVHTHAQWITVLAALRRPLRMLNVRSTYFMEAALSPDDDLATVAPALGEAQTLLIPYHGAITVGPDLGRAAALHVTLEESARIDMRLAGVDVEPMTHAEAVHTFGIMEGADYLALTWDLMTRLGALDG